MIPYSETSDPAESSSGTAYTFGWDAAGKISCPCRGWTTAKPNKPVPRECKHTKGLIKKFELTVEQRGDYQFIVSIDGEDTIETPAPVKKTKLSIQTVTAPALDAYVAPMLASPMPNLPDQLVETVLKALDTYDPSQWAMEEKFDGERKIVAVTPNGIIGWSRPRAGKSALTWNVPTHLRNAFAQLPHGTYDGEVIVPGGISTDVKALKNSGTEIFIVFDVLRLLGQDTTTESYDARRAYLEEIFSRDDYQFSNVRLAESVAPSATDVRAIWKRFGEGAILKRRAARYQPGRRSPDFIKIKGLETAVLTLVGYKAEKLGPHSTMLLRADDGSETTIASMGGGRALLARLDRDPDGHLGRKVRIEYQFRTRDGGYRHPRFDRFEDE